MSPATNKDDFRITELFNVQGKTALVTGGGSGIGLMATQALAVNGAKVYIVGRTKEKLDQVVKVHGQGISGQIIPIVADVSNKAGIQQLYSQIESAEPHLDILVNNAGIAPSNKEKVPEDKAHGETLKKYLLDEARVDEWTAIYTTNVVSPYLMSSAFLPLLERATECTPGWSGTIINITSISGLVRVSQGHFSYNTSKGAFVHLTRMLATEIANSGLKIRVNAIAPGVFPSEMTTKEESGPDQKSYIPKDRYGWTPAERPGNDRDMATAVLFAASCQYLNGQNIPVDGGYLVAVGQ
ncbi:Short-chain dehydrogenase/reductase family protein [Mycena chlorophos]|uniref:Short-chain dehydrogenase/reductase family protein n=1 Tax=Mycena chlorophos TaxID=658473 RepID=A0A8H6TLA9_MYCCL|nr:Short-chain dehydrogenase/reductase family protein [Mycena chlorophos]